MDCTSEQVMIENCLTKASELDKNTNVERGCL